MNVLMLGKTQRAYMYISAPKHPLEFSGDQQTILIYVGTKADVNDGISTLSLKVLLLV